MLLSTMSASFILPSPSGSYFVAINPNTDTLNAVPFADGSLDLLFAAFGQGSVVDFGTLLAHGQESLGISGSTDRRRTWMLLHSGGTIRQFLRHFFATQHALV